MYAVKTEKWCCVRCFPVNRCLDFTVGRYIDEDIKDRQLLLFLFFPRKLYVRKGPIEQIMEVFQHSLVDDNKRVVYNFTTLPANIAGIRTFSIKCKPEHLGLAYVLVYGIPLTSSVADYETLLISGFRIAFALAKLTPISPGFGFGLLVIGFAPGGGPSNLWTRLLGGDLNLSITMTPISSLAALGMLLEACPPHHVTNASLQKNDLRERS
ncbi:unnamed protein product [Dibothriocephalus latus]|uniref:Uncharacterized protein n=1 Tax=Dibothriocephalus latus TaxID=60516 RepID=A0A3P7MP94_DIBLA|nr:unnamed protein product [Dibothriocephalus latus]